jgi:hypothetical protein
MRGGAQERRMPTMQTTDMDVLLRLADDLRLTTWLLPADDELAAHLEMLAQLPPALETWDEVLRPWLHAMRGGAAPAFDTAPRLAAAGAIAMVTARAARELHEDEPLGVVLRCMARWCARSVGAPMTS